MIVYLGGPINGCSDEEASGWRDEVKQVLQEQGHTWRDPMRHDFRGKENEAYRLLVETDKNDINECQVALFNCPRPSWGTAMEILWAWLGRATVVIVLPEGTTPSPWLTYHADLIYYGSVVDAARGL